MIAAFALVLAAGLPAQAQSTPATGDEFVEPPHPDDAASREQLLRPRCTKISGESIDQDVAVEELRT